MASAPQEGRERQQLGLQEAQCLAEAAVGEDDRAAAASAPPLETPTSAGSARGLRNSPCMIAPAAASRPPIIAARRSAESGSTTARAGRAPQMDRRGRRPQGRAPRAGGRAECRAAPTLSATSAGRDGPASRRTAIDASPARRTPRGVRDRVAASPRSVIGGSSPSTRAGVNVAASGASAG